MQKFEAISLKKLNTFGIDVRANSLIVVESRQDLIDIYNKGVFKKKFFILGGGSNVLFVDNYDGEVVQINLKGIEFKSQEQDSIVSCFAGEVWDDFVKLSLERNLNGLENLSLIPGSVGASAVQNIGAYGVEAKDFIESVEYFDIESGVFKTLNNLECEFDYRSSIFKTRLLSQAIVTQVTFRFSNVINLNFTYPDILTYLETHALEQKDVTPQMLRDIICEVRLKKLPYPHEVGNGGSFFKNPVVSKTESEELLKKYPDAKVFPYKVGYLKVSAGWLIEKAGWKGWIDKTKRFGVSHKHALVLVNHSDATGREIFNLSKEIVQSISETFGIRLQEEVVIIH